MSLRNAILFAGGKQTNILRAQWTQRGALQPIMAAAVLVEKDRTPTRYFQRIAKVAFPTLPPLPTVALADAEGRGTKDFWLWFN